MVEVLDSETGERLGVVMGDAAGMESLPLSMVVAMPRRRVRGARRRVASRRAIVREVWCGGGNGKEGKSEVGFTIL